MLKKSIVVLFLSLFMCGSLWAQQPGVSGNITDETGKPVPFATILIHNTTRGTSANSDGNYSISLAPGQYQLTFKAIGYKEEIRQVTVKTGVVVDVKLTIASYQLNDVVIRAGGEDPAYGIIRKAIRRRKVYLNEVNSYTADVYLKGLQKLLAAPKKFLGRDINQIGREIGLDSNRRGIVYLSESQSKLSFLKPGQYHEEMISSKVSGSNRAFSFNRASDINVNFYENYQTWGQLSNRPLVSPIADNALSFYNYKLLGTIVENGETINKIQLIPKHNYEPVFRGLIYIVEDTWRIHSFDVEINKSANLNVVDTLKVREQYMPVGKVWMPASVKLEFTGGFLGFKFAGYFIAVYNNYEINPSLSKRQFAEILLVPRGINKKDSTYWQSQRPVPLTLEETTDYKKKAILAAKRESKPYLDSLDKVYNRVTPNKLLFTGILHRNRFKKEYLYLDPVIPSMVFNTVEGFAINYGATFIKQIDSLNNKYLVLGANARYGFTNHLVHANVNGTIPMDAFTLGFSGGSGIYDINYTDPVSALSNTYNSLFRKANLMKLYEKDFATLSLSRRIVGGWQASVSTEFANRKWLPNTAYFSILDPEHRKYTSNNPFSPDLDVPLFPENQSFSINARTSYNFSNKYVTYPTGRYYLPSAYPKLEFSYTKGFKNILGSDVDYDLLSASLSKEDISLGVYGKSSFYLGAGKFLNNKQLYFIDYAQFFANDGFLYRISPSRFLFLDLYRYSTPDRYFEAHLEHNFSGYLLNNVPLIRKLKLQEIVDFNYLTTPVLKNYYEFAAGVHYLNFRLMYAQSYKDGKKSGEGIKIGIMLPQRPGFR